MLCACTLVLNAFQTIETLCVKDSVSPNLFTFVMCALRSKELLRMSIDISSEVYCRGLLALETSIRVKQAIAMFFFFHSMKLLKITLPKKNLLKIMHLRSHSSKVMP